MAYIIETNEDETISLILPDDTVKEARDIDTILAFIRIHYTEETQKIIKNADKSGQINRLFEF